MEQELSIDLNELNFLFSKAEEPTPENEGKETREIKESNNNETTKEASFLDLADLTSVLKDQTTTSGSTNTTSETKTNSKSDELIRAIAKDFYQEGLLEVDKEEDLDEVTNYESFAKALAKTISKNELKDLTDDQKQYLKAIRAGVTEDEVVAVQRNIKQLQSLDIAQLNKNIEWQKQLVSLDLEEKGIDNETAKTMVESFSKSSPDEFYKMSLKAKIDLEGLYKSRIDKEIQTKEDNYKTQLKEEEDKIVKMKEKILKSNEVIPGFRLNDETKNEIWKSIVKPTAIKGQSSPMNEVMEKYSKDEAYRISLHTLHVLTKGFTDFTNLEKKFQNKVTRNIDQFLENDRFTTGSSGGASNSSSSNTRRDIISALNSL